MKKGINLAVLAMMWACGGSEQGAVESYVSAVNPDSSAREVMVHCSRDVWTIHVRATSNVRAIEIGGSDWLAYATVDYRWTQDGDPLGYGFVAPVPVVTEAERQRLQLEGSAATTTSCDAGTLPMRLRLMDDEFEARESLALDEAVVPDGVTDITPNVNHRRGQ